MITPSPPFPVLSADGNALLVLDGATAVLWRRDGQTRRMALPFVADRAALSPGGRFLAVGGSEQVAVLPVDDGPMEDGDWPTEGVRLPVAHPVFRLAVGDDGSAVAALSQERQTSSLLCWPNPREMAAPMQAELGQCAAYHLAWSPQSGDRAGHLLVWGLAGPRAFAGAGRHFARLLEWSEALPGLLWSAESLVRPARGYLFPPGAQWLGVNWREHLEVYPLSALPPAPPAQTHSLAHLEQVAASLGGKHVAWLWSEEARAGQSLHHLRVASLPDGREIDRADFEQLGHFPTLAVDDNGRATLAYGLHDERVVVCSLETGRWATDLKITLSGI